MCLSMHANLQCGGNVMGNIEEKEEKIFEELRNEILKQSGEELIRVGQSDAITAFSKFWVTFEEQLDSLLDEDRTQVDEAIRSWIGLQIEKRRR